jgi:hypothetical protein
MATENASGRTEAIGSIVRYPLGVLLAFGALNALAGGYYGLAGAEGVPTEWLEGSPFRTYTIPSVLLLVVVGGSLLLAALAVWARWRSGRLLAMGASIIVLGWIVVQLSIIGHVSWMQPATAIGGLIIFILAWALPERHGGRRART